MTPENHKTLERFARKYIWWKTAADALGQPTRIMAQVMDIGDYADVRQLERAFGENTLRQVLQQAGAGCFKAKSWAYWHYRLGLALPGQLPPLPQRRFAMP